jgi:hypothetical protein
MTHRFVKELNKLIQSKKFSKHKVYHFCSDSFEKQTNGAFLMGAYMLIALGKTAEEAWEIFTPYHK